MTIGTLVEASKRIEPILQSELFKNSPELQKKWDEVAERVHTEGIDLPLGLNQLVVLTDKQEAAFQELIDMYTELSVKQKA